MELKERFRTYKEMTNILDEHGIPFLVGGGIAVMSYCNRRPTKDIDLYIEPDKKTAALEALRENGYDINEMDEVHWISKAYKKGLIIDFILENVGGVITTADTIRHGKKRDIFGYEFNVMSPEDLILRKILAMRSTRNDWYDAIVVLWNTYEAMDWDYFLSIIGEHYERALSFLLYVRSDNEHIIPIPDYVVSTLIKKM
ncbi:hypothetical protein CUJ83_08085 [Methanocella sp. CWC-04]|uniref:Uncharacterized protein n=1 Tax=Methanooceanicella nereidis TaxID=2052831 RepID=A0AAP2RF47_9EURY|nr:nucleotidyltransferase [Methanocella sp. CWC-04]MCD1294955.1 hypothetical protein [Methanocella sp. CWC-04]